MKVKFGAGLSGDIAPGRMAELARFLEKNNFHQIWISDDRFRRDPYSLLTLCALNTRKVKLGTAVTDPFIRHASLTALGIGTVDEISGGRVLLGMGAGVTGFKELGIKHDRPAVAIREAVSVIRDLWAGKRVSASGDFVRCQNLKLDFKARPNISVYIAGRGPVILRLAGEIGDGAIVGALASTKGVRYAIGKIHEGLAHHKSPATSKDFDVVLWVSTAVSDDRNSARNLVRPMVAYVLYSSRAVLSELGVDEHVVGPVLKEFEISGDPLGNRRAAQLVPDAVVDAFSLAGKPSEIAERIMELEEAGVKQVAFLPFAPGEEDAGYVFRKISKQVIPLLK